MSDDINAFGRLQELIACDGELLVAQDDLECAYVGQKFRLWRVEDNGTRLYVELKCGHPLWVFAHEVQLSPSGLEELKEKTMSDKPATTNTDMIPAPKAAPTKKAKNGSSKLPVTGYEHMVLALRQKQGTLKWIEEEVDNLKSDFRIAAAQAAAQAPGDVASLSFEDGKGGNVTVSLPKLDMDGNRLSVKDEAVAEFSQKGLELGPHLECFKSYVLTGEFVEWLDTLLAQWAEQGVQVPDGLEEKVVTRLSPEGAAALKTMAKDGNEVAHEALNRFIKAATIRVSK